MLDQRPLPRLLVLASTYPRWAGDHEPGFVHELSKRLASDFKVTVLCPHAPGTSTSENLDGVEVVRYRYAPRALETLVNDGGIVTNLRLHRWKILLVPGFVLAQAWAAWRLIRCTRIDVIHAHWLVPQGLVATLLKAITGTPYLVTSHGADLYALRAPPFQALKRLVARHAAAITVVSTSMRERILSLGVDTSKVNVQPMGVDMAQRFTPVPSMKRSERKILFVGRLVEKKGLVHLLSAMPRVLQRIPDARLAIAGFGPGEAEAQALVESLGLQPAVHFLGAVPQTQLPDLYRSAAVFVAPFVRAVSGDEEGLGLVLVEAIACGCPVLAGNVPALGEVLGQENMDVTVDPRDHDRLADHIVASLMQPECARARAEQLRQSLGRRLDWASVTTAYAQTLRHLAGKA
ncbi:glycosyltransferase [Stenotrophomonas sp. W1S232]|uniref:Glycosyltransferase n=1 Tax=Stenotrophomonas koreensis TaxID=266128 RepID=A0A7W3V1J6_9GAMM|nr:glycosyltransferase [Stenotrophomonas koreensis]MBB1117750.1 glycosyltransferase [Stenotrophomonas koreensis]